MFFILEKIDFQNFKKITIFQKSKFRDKNLKNQNLEKSKFSKLIMKFWIFPNFDFSDFLSILIFENVWKCLENQCSSKILNMYLVDSGYL